jgi:hypothetical protein
VRALIAIAIFTASLSAVGNEILARMGLKVYPPPVSCPPGDRLDWRQTDSPKARDILWIRIPPEQLRSLCNPKGWEPPPGSTAYVTACAFTQPDGLGVVYALMPRDQYPQFLIEHEECHTQGWRHCPLGDRECERDRR